MVSSIKVETMAQPYVMFGVSNLFGDLVDILHLRGFVLKKVVLNMPLPPEQLERVNRLPYPVQVEPILEFSPEEGELYCIGFKGPQMIPLRSFLKKQFALFFTPLIHPTAIVSPTVEVTEGCMLGAGVILASYVRLGHHVVINRGSTIGHDAQMDDYVFVGPSVCICSAVHLEEGAQIFAGSTIIEKKVIGKESQVAAGAVCLCDVPPHVMVAGVPAKQKKSLNSLINQFANEIDLSVL